MLVEPVRLVSIGTDDEPETIRIGLKGPVPVGAPDITVIYFHITVGRNFIEVCAEGMGMGYDKGTALLEKFLGPPVIRGEVPAVVDVILERIFQRRLPPLRA